MTQIGRSLTLCALLAALPAMAQGLALPPMNHVDLRRPTAEAADVIASWNDRIADTNRAWAMSNGALPNGQNAPSDILWQRFDRDGVQITASIFFGQGCDGGPNSSTSEQGWSVCPARVSIASGGSTKVLQTQACYQYFPIADGQEPPEENRSYVTADAGGSVVTFSATQDGRDVPSCNRRVRIGR